VEFREMAESSIAQPPRNWARLLLLALVIIPFIPEIAIVATAALARLLGCVPAESSTCLIAQFPVSSVITLALRAKASFIVGHVTDPEHQNAWLSALYLAVAAWLVACYVVAIRGWTHFASRFVIGLVVTLIFAVLPYFGSILAISDLANEHCRPNEGGVGPCRLFGDYVGSRDYSPAHDAVQIGWLSFGGAPLALALFVLYAIVVIVIAVRRRKPAAAST
jgi:hypothetical protein